jgi:hypothetical protein
MVLLLSQLASARLEYRMENTSLNWSFGDPTGWTIACIFFVAISSVIGGGYTVCPIASSAWALSAKDMQ